MKEKSIRMMIRSGLFEKHSEYMAKEGAVQQPEFRRLHSTFFAVAGDFFECGDGEAEVRLRTLFRQTIFRLPR